MKQLKIVAALIAGLFTFTSVQAGEMSITGTMQATYNSQPENQTGNSLGMNTDLTFTGATDTDFGTATWSLATDGTFLGESGADHTLKIATVAGTFGVGNTGDAANAVDDITPSAFEEANGSGSGSYSAADFGSGMDGSMSLSYQNLDLFGTGIGVNYNYYPRLDATTNNEKASSSTADNNASSAQSVNVKLPLAGIPVVGDSAIGGTAITVGYEQSDSNTTDANAKEGATVAVVIPAGPLSLGYQKKVYQPIQTSVADSTKVHYKDDIVGVAYAINEDLAISYNVIESAKHDRSVGGNIEQETKAINLAYTVGGLTLAFQDGKTDNSGWVDAVSKDSRTISIKTAF